MKKSLLFLPLLLALGACGFDKPPPETEQQPSGAGEPAPVEGGKPGADAGDPGLENAPGAKDPALQRLEDFASRLAGDGKGHFRYNRVRDAKEGGKERQVYVEMTGLTDIQAADEATRILTGLGYEQGRRWSDENGVRIRFFDVGNIPVSVLARSRKAHPLLNHDDSTSSVYLTRPVGE